GNFWATKLSRMILKPWQHTAATNGSSLMHQMSSFSRDRQMISANCFSLHHGKKFRSQPVAADLVTWADACQFVAGLPCRWRKRTGSKKTTFPQQVTFLNPGSFQR